MQRSEMPWERASEQPAWYDNQPYDIGDRLQVTQAVPPDVVAGATGRVVGYDASGPRHGEDFVRILIILDTRPDEILALPPHALAPAAGSERQGLARNLLISFEQQLAPAAFQHLLAWLTGAECRRIAADPATTRKRLSVGGLKIPGFLLPELIALAEEHREQR